MINHLNLHVPQPPALCQGGRLPARLPARRAPAAPRASTNGAVNNGASANGARRLALADPPPVSEEVQALMTEQGIADLETSGLLYLSNDARARSPLERPSQRSWPLVLGPAHSGSLHSLLRWQQVHQKGGVVAPRAGVSPGRRFAKQRRLGWWLSGTTAGRVAHVETRRVEVSRSCAVACQLLGQSVGGALGGGSTCQGSRLCRAVST